MGLEEFGGPALPFGKQYDKGLLSIREGVAAEEFGGGGRRSSAGVEQRDRDFAAGERVVEHGNVPDDQRDESKAGAGFDHDKGARREASRQDVADAQGEQRRSTDIEVRSQAIDCGGAGHRVSKWRVQAKEEEGEASDQ